MIAERILDSTPAPGELASSPRAADAVAVGYLRAFITLMVLAHHAVLAYHPYAPPPPASLTASRWWEAFPIVDSQRWGGFALLVAFNDMFFMALMFFLSGLFVWSSLLRKGSGTFLKDRALRLGVPFVAAAAVIAPLAYYPSYLQTGAAPGLGGFWKQWSSLGHWPAGPAWFLWVLLAFDVVAAGLFLRMPRWGERLGGLALGAQGRPARFFGLLVVASAAVYIPMALVFNPIGWTTFGPFVFQTSRLLFYALYFFAGIAVGAYGLQRGLLAPDGKLAQRWFVWLPAALITFGAAMVVILGAISHPESKGWGTAAGLAFVLSCAASGFAFLSVFVRFARKRSKVLDSLRDNAYGMYLIHYAFVSWLQFLLLKAALSGLAKGVVAFVGAVVLSWGATAVLRRIPSVARVI